MEFVDNSILPPTDGGNFLNKNNHEFLESN